MPILHTGKIDIRKLDSKRYFEGKADANGYRPLWCDIAIIPLKQKGRFGDTHIIKQSKKKDEQVDLPIVGNATERGGAPAPQSDVGRGYQYEEPARTQTPTDGGQDAPF